MATVACLASAAAKLPSEEGCFLIVKGVYTFLNYASKHWAEQVLVHAESRSRGGCRDVEFENALECLAGSLDRICISAGIVPPNGEQVDPRLEHLNNLCGIQTHANMALLFQSQSPTHLQSQTKTDSIITSEPIQFFDAVSVLLQKYRDAVRQMLCQGYHLGVTRDEFELFRTQVQILFFTCRLPHCPSSSIGFETEAQLILHELEHSKGFPCHYLGCQFPPFRSQKALSNHILKYHTQSVPRRGLRRMREFYSNQGVQRQLFIGPTSPRNAVAQYIELRASPCEPAAGIFGTRVFIKIIANYDLFLISPSMPYFFLQFGSKKCPMKEMAKDTHHGSGFIYTCSTDAPQLLVTGCHSNNVPVSLVIEEPSGGELSRTIIGNFEYLERLGDDGATRLDKMPVSLNGGATGTHLEQQGHASASPSFIPGSPPPFRMDEYTSDAVPPLYSMLDFPGSGMEESASETQTGLLGRRSPPPPLPGGVIRPTPMWPSFNRYHQNAQGAAHAATAAVPAQSHGDLGQNGLGDSIMVRRSDANHGKGIANNLKGNFDPIELTKPLNTGDVPKDFDFNAFLLTGDGYADVSNSPAYESQLKSFLAQKDEALDAFHRF